MAGRPHVCSLFGYAVRSKIYENRGPVLTYMANCNGDCTKFDGSNSPVWFKIDEAGLSSTQLWASKLLIENSMSFYSQFIACICSWYAIDNTWSITLPKSLKSGQYLQPHEIIALHLAGTCAILFFR